VIKQGDTYKIVMVDDDQDDLFLTKISFRRAGYPVDFIGLKSGVALFDFIKNQGIGSIDILLLDINMPVQSGHDILARLKDYPHFGDIKVVMFSTSRMPGDLTKSFQKGATDFMVKPSSQADTESFLDHIGDMLMSEQMAVA